MAFFTINLKYLFNRSFKALNLLFRPERLTHLCGSHNKIWLNILNTKERCFSASYFSSPLAEEKLDSWQVMDIAVTVKSIVKLCQVEVKAGQWPNGKQAAVTEECVWRVVAGSRLLLLGDTGRREACGAAPDISWWFLWSLIHCYIHLQFCLLTLAACSFLKIWQMWCNPKTETRLEHTGSSSMAQLLLWRWTVFTHLYSFSAALWLLSKYFRMNLSLLCKHGATAAAC